MESTNELIFGERFEDLVPGLVHVKGMELDEDWTLRVRRPLMLWHPEVWSLGRAVRRAEASLPDGIQLFGPPSEAGLQILNQRQFDAYVAVMRSIMRVAVPRILTQAREGA